MPRKHTVDAPPDSQTNNAVPKKFFFNAFENMAECPICLQVTELCTLMPCNHGFCRACLRRVRKPMCSLCRQNTCGFECVDDSPPRLCMPIPPGRHVGITVKNHRYGVEVTKVNARDLAATCLSKRDVITQINGLRPATHTDAVVMINTATDNNITLYCAVHRHDSAVRSRLRRALAWLQ